LVDLHRTKAMPIHRRSTPRMAPPTVNPSFCVELSPPPGAPCSDAAAAVPVAVLAVPLPRAVGVATPLPPPPPVED